MALLDVLQSSKIKEELEETRKQLATVNEQLERTQKERDAFKQRLVEGGKQFTVFKDRAENLQKQFTALRDRAEALQKERDGLRGLLEETERMSIAEIRKAISDLEEQKAGASRELDQLRETYHQKRDAVDEQLGLLQKQADEKRQELVILDDEILLQSFGIYKPLYDWQNSETYKVRLEDVREKQAMMVKSGKAASCPKHWVVNNSEKEGERMIKDYTKLIVRSFNNECDASMVKVKFNNIESIGKKIQKAFETLNKLASVMNITISPQYFDLKMEELHLCYEYQLKVQEEKEEQKRIREEMREEAKLMKEIEEMKARLAKEEKHFSQALDSVNGRLQKAQTEAERELLEKEKSNIEEEQERLKKNKLDVEMREQNTRAGYVYVISNIGSFGEDIYKIGMTRRLEPEERVSELGDASVPFNFDIHAMIFSENAPALESALHRAFEERKLNIVNPRREFFAVTLQEIEQVVTTNFSKPVEFVTVPEAAQYRESLNIKQQLGAEHVVTTETIAEEVEMPDLFA